MHGEAEWQGFESFLVVWEADGTLRKLVEHGARVDREEGVQDCYVIGRVRSRIGIGYRFHHKRPEYSDFQIDVKVDGFAIYRYLVKEHWHQVMRVDRVHRSHEHEVLPYALHLEDLPLPNDAERWPDNAYEDDPNEDRLDIGTIQIEVRRGNADKKSTHCESLAVDFRKGRFPLDSVVPATMKDEPLRLRARDPLAYDGREPVVKGKFVVDPRDVESPWFTQTYKYRSLKDLRRKGIVEQEPAVTEHFPYAASYLGIKKRNTEAKIAALEAEIRALRLTLEGRALPTPPSTPSSSSAEPHRRSGSASSSRASIVPKAEPSSSPRPRPAPYRMPRRSGSEQFSGLTRARAISVSSDELTPGDQRSSAIPLLSDDSDDE